MKKVKQLSVASLLVCSISFTGCSPEQTDLERLYCLPSKEAFFSAWGITSPSLPCPYQESDRRSGRLVFTDQSSVDIIPGPYDNGGVFIQDLNCNQSTDNGFLSYILIRWATEPKNGSYTSTYPIFNCSGRTGKAITLKDAAGILHLLYTTTTSFRYYDGTTTVEKEIETIQFT
jgi:hypothetical protein